MSALPAPQAWDDANPDAPLMGVALTGARIAVGAEFADELASYPAQVRILAAVALFRSGRMTAKAAARAFMLGEGNRLSPSSLERSSVTEAMIRIVQAYIDGGTLPPQPALDVTVQQPDAAGKSGRAARPAASRSNVTRFASAEIDPSRVVDLAADHPAIINGHSIFTDGVLGTLDSPRFLVSGHNNAKLGKTILKGERTGWPLFHLTLEERATCPRSCAQWRGCYGNAMPYARRHRVDADFMTALRGEVITKARENPAGLLIRLHTLGDFFSVAYVLMWAELLAALPQLHVFGYTARREDDADPETRKIAQAIRILTDAMWSRFSIRTSHTTAGPQRSIVVEKPVEVAGVIMCPQQADATAACSTCGLCWVDRCRDRTIAFLKHGMKRGARQKADPMPEAQAAPAEVVEPPPQPVAPAESPAPTLPARPVSEKPRSAARVPRPKRAMPRGARIESLGDGVQVIRIQPISDRTLNWVRRYHAAGSTVAELADLFNLDADDLARRLGQEA